MTGLERWSPSVPKALLERTVVGVAPWRILSSYVKLLVGVSLKAQDHVITAHLPSLQRHAPSYDLLVVGGGIVGMATARELALRYPEMSIALVEKEPRLAMGQTGHNSGVIHMGLYYTPGSLKARLCVRGADLIYQYMDKRGIPYNKCGKVIVATDDDEVNRLRALYTRALVNGCKDIRLVNAEELKSIEPHCVGKMAIHSPHTGIVDWSRVTRAYAEDFTKAGGRIHTSYEVCGFDKAEEDNIAVQAKNGETLRAKWIISCCGLYSDRVAMMSGSPAEPKVVPIRGEYLVLDSSKCHLVKGNIYPVPNPQFPFLGVHFTPRMDGSVWVGPNAVLAFSREGYSYTDISWTDLKEMLCFSGLRKLMVKHWQFGAGEMWRSLNRRAQLKRVKKFIPGLTLSDLQPGPSGVRAMAMDSTGSMMGDFVFDQGQGEVGQRMLHVRNAPSPGATSSLAIAEMVADKAANTFKWTT
ncbi:L-2-hydroxyglutarate dehydrogenase, mitochondrial-like [Halichondria panicea]|uniref:L-2-hydroxyglutarate dehydrogenase, mitochondrial-like n=1 Tax=Halichondria panicea TaxID=6063 RepID=UPI00312B379D